MTTTVFALTLGVCHWNEFLMRTTRNSHGYRMNEMMRAVLWDCQSTYFLAFDKKRYPPAWVLHVFMAGDELSQVNVLVLEIVVKTTHLSDVNKVGKSSAVAGISACWKTNFFGRIENMRLPCKHTGEHNNNNNLDDNDKRH